MRKYVKRYCIQAKRKGVIEPWSEWTSVNNYLRAVHHKEHVEELGHMSRIKFNDDGVEELWEILGGDTELADKIFDADFRKEDTVINETLVKVFDILNRLTYENEKALREQKELGNVDETLHYTWKKGAFLQMKEALAKVTEETEETEETEGEDYDN